MILYFKDRPMLSSELLNAIDDDGDEYILL